MENNTNLKLIKLEKQDPECWVETFPNMFRAKQAIKVLNQFLRKVGLYK